MWVVATKIDLQILYKHANVALDSLAYYKGTTINDLGVGTEEIEKKKFDFKKAFLRKK